MSWLKRFFGLRLSTEAFDIRLGQVVFFTAGPAFLFLAFRGLARLSLSQGEAFIGILASLAVFLLIILIGFVLPLANQKAGAKPPEKPHDKELA